MHVLYTHISINVQNPKKKPKKNIDQNLIHYKLVNHSTQLHICISFCGNYHLIADLVS